MIEFCGKGKTIDEARNRAVKVAMTNRNSDFLLEYEVKKIIGF